MITLPTFLRTFLLSFVLHLRELLASRRTLVLLAASALPALGAQLLWSFGAADLTGAEVITHVSWLLLLQVMIPLGALLSGAPVIADQAAANTLLYAFVRPVSRAGFFVGRWLAACLQMALLVGIAGLLMAVVGAVGESNTRQLLASFVAVALFGGIVYTTVFAALGCATRHPVILGLAYSCALEGLMANLPGRTAVLSVQHHLRSLLVDDNAAWKAVPQSGLATYEPAPDAVFALILIGVGALMVGCVVVSKRQYGAAA